MESAMAMDFLRTEGALRRPEDDAPHARLAIRSAQRNGPLRETVRTGKMGVKEELSRGQAIGPVSPYAIIPLMDFSRYIDVNDPDGPKLIGHRIWLHDIIWQIVAHNFSDLQLLEQFPTLNREKVLAALLY